MLGEGRKALPVSLAPPAGCNGVDAYESILFQLEVSSEK